MALNNRERVGKGFEYLAEGLGDFVDDVMTRATGSAAWNEVWAEEDSRKHGTPARTYAKTDPQVQLRAITEQGYRFKDSLSRAQQGFASELRDYRNKWAHNEPFSSADAERALDTIERLLRAVDAPDSAEDVKKLRLDLRRVTVEEQTRQQVRRAKVLLDPAAGLKPWREVLRPHDDVARGAFNASEFAADLHRVHTGEVTDPEYADPKEFFSRTYMTEGLKDLTSRALRRMSGDTNVSPVVNLQTNFGGGKTHSMLTLYHLFGGTPAIELTDEVQKLVADNGGLQLESAGVKRVVLVGTALQPGTIDIKVDGTEVHTLWGELAWQLGGAEAYAMVAEADKTRTNPGDALSALLERYSPAIILIDEWVAYARQLVGRDDLPAGTFETQFTFAQALTEAVQTVPGAMVVVSIPASDASGRGGGSDIEVAGENGRQALERLQNVIGRVADQWRPSSKDESFEIVRRRIFQQPDSVALTAIARAARSFTNMYRNTPALFPRDTVVPGDDYESRIRATYPLHPELLDRLYEDWSTLERFQQTRGVLKLVSSIVHELWTSQDSSVLILPGNVPLDTPVVSTDLGQYLEDQWKPIIDTDVSGESSTAAKIDESRPNLQQRFVTQRLARTVFMGATPRLKSNRKGLDKQYVWLGTAVPGDVLGNFGTALDLLSQQSTYFYEDQGHYWFDTQASVSKLASDHAERLREEVDIVWNEIARRLEEEQRQRGDFDRVHVAPGSTADIPDLEETRLVIAHPRYARRKSDDDSSQTMQWVRSAVENKGASQRVHRNALVFLLPDQQELASLEAAVRSYLGWKKVKAQSESLDLSIQQQKQTTTWIENHNQSVNDRIRSTYIWAAYPEQADPSTVFDIGIQRIPDSGESSLTLRTAARLKREGLLVTQFGPGILGTNLRGPLRSVWNSEGQISVGQLWGYHTRYPYLERLVRRSVLDRAIEAAVDEVALGADEDFAIASAVDPETGRYRDLIVPPSPGVSIQITDQTLLVEMNKARAQKVEDLRIAEQQRINIGEDGGSSTALEYNGDLNLPTDDVTETSQASNPEKRSATRFFGGVNVDIERYARVFGDLQREIIQHLLGAGADVSIRVDIEASKPEGFTENEKRTISENAMSLRFEGSQFDA